MTKQGKKKVTSLSEYFGEIAMLQTSLIRNGADKNEELLFRGHSDSTYTLLPALGRNRSSTCSISILNEERNMIESAKNGKTAQRQAAIQTRKQIIQRNSAGGYRSSSNYKFALNSNKSRIDRLTKNLKIEAISEVLISTYITLDITVYQSLIG